MLFKKVTKFLGTLLVFLWRLIYYQKNLWDFIKFLLCFKIMNFIMIEKEQIQHLIVDIQIWQSFRGQYTMMAVNLNLINSIYIIKVQFRFKKP